ncbi:MAG: nitroreductase family protein [bacterium]|nr:nitroreductase family protein [bacterium]
MTEQLTEKQATVLGAIRERRSVRCYQDQAVPQAILREALDAARWAPSAANNQPWQFLVVTRPDLRRALGRHARWHFIRWRHVAQAPVVVVILGNPAANRWHLVDCAMAGQNLMLAAHALGLGTCWIGAFDPRGVRQVLAIPERLAVVGLVTLGYPAERPAPPPRLDLDEVVFAETYPARGGPGLTRRLRQTGLLSLGRRIRRS